LPIDVVPTENMYRRPLKFSALFVLTFFGVPLSLRAALYVSDQTPSTDSYVNEKADMSSTGLLPPAMSHPAARVLLMSVPVAGKRGQFISHSWIVFKRENARNWSRYEVLGFAGRDTNGAPKGQWLGNTPTLNRYVPDGRWFGRSPVVIADAKGTTAETMIPKIEAVVENYETMAGRYRFWPGPNSNTFVASVSRAIPELRATLPATAIGKDFRSSVFVGFTDSGTGIEASLLGIFGAKIGQIEGAEINLFGFIAGLDLAQPGLKIPGFGRIDFGASGIIFFAALIGAGTLSVLIIRRRLSRATKGFG
jgi:Protein of unknown function (DUF3750)